MKEHRLHFWSMEADERGLPHPPRLPANASAEQIRRAEYDHQQHWDLVERGLDRAQYIKEHSTPIRKPDPANWLKPVVKK
jgi:hypothetical protein